MGTLVLSELYSTETHYIGHNRKAHSHVNLRLLCNFVVPFVSKKMVTKYTKQRQRAQSISKVVINKTSAIYLETIE